MRSVGAAKAKLFPNSYKIDVEARYAVFRARILMYSGIVRHLKSLPSARASQAAAAQTTLARGLAVGIHPMSKRKKPMKSKSGKILVVAMSTLFMALPVTEASAKMTRRDRNVAIGVGIGLGVLGAAIIASQGAKASPRRDTRDYDYEGDRVLSCRDLKYMCRVEDREWACRKYRRHC